MRHNKILLSTIVITLMSGCVKPTEEVNTKKNTTDATVYNEQPNEIVYGDDVSSEPIIYTDPATTDTTTTATTAPTTTNNGIYNSGVESSTLPPATTGTYQQTTTVNSTPPSSSDHYQPPSGGGYPSPTPSGAYSDPYSAGGDVYGSPSSIGGGYSAIDDPYAPSSSSSSSRSSSSTYSTNLPYGTSSSSSSYGSGSSGTHKKGIQLQVAALRDYYAAEEFRKGLSLDPKYGSYVKRGPINKVIITGIPTRAEAKALAARQFPGAFIVGGTETSSSYSGGSSYSTPSYTPPSYSSGGGNINSGIGVQIGAFTSKDKARAIAQEKARGEYTAVVKTAQVRGRTMYKAILLGFATRAEAKRAIASGRFGDAFVVMGIHP